MTDDLASLDAECLRYRGVLWGFEPWMMEWLMGGMKPKPPAGYADGVRQIAAAIKHAIEALGENPESEEPGA
jgi:hypothetical protein